MVQSLMVGKAWWLCTLYLQSGNRESWPPCFLCIQSQIPAHGVLGLLSQLKLSRNPLSDMPRGVSPG